MIHTIERISFAYATSKTELEKFAGENINKYGIFESYGELCTSNWDVNSLIADFKQTEWYKTHGEAYRKQHYVEFCSVMRANNIKV